MLINEVSKQCALTKKAIDYYTEQGLIHPGSLENGYRDFSSDEVLRLKKISVLRKLGLSIDEIKAVLNNTNKDTLRKLSVKKALEIERETTKLALIEKLCRTGDFEATRSELTAVEQNKTIVEKLLETFPGYYGRYISLHFSFFLGEPITTPAQQEAFDSIVEFLDHVQGVVFPEDLKKYLEENTNDMDAETILGLSADVKKSIENPEQFIAENKEMLDWYVAYRKSDEFRNSPGCKLMTMAKSFGNTSGYYDVFIPAMRKLSSSYNEYQMQLEIANQKMCEQFPDIIL